MKIRRFPAAVVATATLSLLTPFAPSAVGQGAPVFGPVPAASAPATTLDRVQLSGGAEDVLKLSRAKVNDDVIVAFIANGNRNYYLTASEILYLRKEGVSDRVLTAMLGQSAPGATPPPAQAPTYAAEASAPQYIAQPATTEYIEPVPASTVYLATTPYYSFYDPWPYWNSWYAYPAFSFGFYWGWGWGGCGYWGGYPNYCYRGYWNNYCNNGYYPPASNGSRPPPPGSTALVSEGRQPSGVSRARPLVSEMRQPSGVNQGTPLVSEGRQPSGVAGASQAATRDRFGRVENRSAGSTSPARTTSYWSGNGGQSRPSANQPSTTSSGGGRAVAPTRLSENRTFATRPAESRSTAQFTGDSRGPSPTAAWAGSANQRPSAPASANQYVTYGARPGSSPTWSQPASPSGARYMSSPTQSYQRSASPSYRGGGSMGNVSRPSMSPSFSSRGSASSFQSRGSSSGASAPGMSSGGGGSRGGGSGGGGGRSR